MELNYKKDHYLRKLRPPNSVSNACTLNQAEVYDLDAQHGLEWRRKVRPPLCLHVGSEGT